MVITCLLHLSFDILDWIGESMRNKKYKNSDVFFEAAHRHGHPITSLDLCVLKSLVKSTRSQAVPQQSIWNTASGALTKWKKQYLLVHINRDATFAPATTFLIQIVMQKFTFLLSLQFLVNISTDEKSNKPYCENNYHFVYIKMYNWYYGKKQF